MARNKIVAGNWKMNKTAKEAVSFIGEIKELVAGSDTEVVVCVPFLAIPSVVEATKGTNIKVGAQNIHWEEKGAFTGEISGPMLKEAGVDYVVIGHSERRQFFGETDETVNKRLQAALKYDLRPILCVGESLIQRERGVTEEVARCQTKVALLGLMAEQVKQVVIAYEPIWAIGTGKTATKEQANEGCACIRDCVAQLYSKEVAEEVIIQYGGSVTADTAKELFTMSDIDGGLVGGASLKSLDFQKIVKYNS